MNTASEVNQNPTPRNHRNLIAIGAVVCLILLAGCTRYMVWAHSHVQTDDAYLTGHLHEVSSRIAGTVTEVDIDDNQPVKAGQVLAKLDSQALQVQLDQAKAALVMAQRQGDPASIAVARAAVEQAQLQLSYTVITAPSDGMIGKKTLEVGESIQPGQPLMALVEPQTWVVANFKETQLANMRAGQPVEVDIDSYAGRKFRGTVESFAPASGSQFALLPADNATGNFTKVVQRVPVKIVLSDDSLHGMQGRLAPGLSAVVTVKVR